MTQSSLSDHTRDDDRAGRLVRAIRAFVGEFAARQEGAQLRRLLEGDDPDGGVLGQAPEDFTEHELIEPCLDALGYRDPKRDDVSTTDPQFGRQPSQYPKVERKRPDYELRNIHDRLTCIVEVKAINCEPPESRGEATKDITAYLADDTFCKHARNQPPGVLVGIGTDGFRWTLWGKDLDTGTVYEKIAKTSIIDSVSGIEANRLRERTDTEEARERRAAAQDDLKANLVRFFSRENLLCQIDDTIDRIDFEARSADGDSTVTR